MNPNLSKSAIQKSAGFTLIEVLIGTVIITISALALGSYLVGSYKEIKQTEKILTLYTIRLATLSNILSDGSWKATVNDTNNTNLDCIRNQTPCPVTTSRPFKLKDASLVLYYDATSPTSGFNLDGNLCNQYDDINGSDFCPIRLDLSFTPECIAPCIPSGLIKVNAVFKYNPKSEILKISSARQTYTINVIRNAVAL